LTCSTRSLSGAAPHLHDTIDAVTFIHLLIVLAVIGAVAAVAAGRVRGGLSEPTSTLPDVELPDGPMATEDVDSIRFSVGFRGYRMDEVDAVLDRLGLELGAREEEIRELREEIDGGPERLQTPGRHAPVDAPPEVP
jgi:DivIVA domain-containing protein